MNPNEKPAPNKKLNLTRETVKHLGVKSGVMTGTRFSPILSEAGNSVGRVSSHIESWTSWGGFGGGGGGGGGG